jgi:hypothetical protein
MEARKMIVDKKKAVEFIKRFEFINFTFSQDGKYIIGKFKINLEKNEEYDFIWCTEKKKIKSVINKKTNKEISLNLQSDKVIDYIFGKDYSDRTFLYIKLRFFYENELYKFIVEKMVTLLEDYVTIKITGQLVIDNMLYINCNFELFDNTYEIEIKKSYGFNELLAEKYIIKEVQNVKFSKHFKKIAIENNSDLKLLETEIFERVFGLSQIMKFVVLTEFKKTSYYKMKVLYEPDFKKVFL